MQSHNTLRAEALVRLLTWEMKVKMIMITPSSVTGDAISTPTGRPDQGFLALLTWDSNMPSPTH